MKTVNVHDAKTRLSSLLAEIERTGKGIIICRNGEPVADLVPHVHAVSMAADNECDAARCRHDRHACD